MGEAVEGKEETVAIRPFFNTAINVTMSSEDGTRTYAGVSVSPVDESNWGGDLAVYRLWVHRGVRRMGVGTRLMNVVINEYGKTASLHILAIPWADGEMTAEQLEAWYAKLGFVKMNDGRMVKPAVSLQLTPGGIVDPTKGA